MHHILYMSTAVGLPTDDDLKSILIESRKNNEAKNITGVLLYSEGTFVQLLEGTEEHVQSAYNKLLSDRRHKSAICLIDTPAAHRVFPEWWMGFSKISDKDMRELKGYLENSVENLSVIKDDQPAVHILKTFVDNNARSLA